MARVDKITTTKRTPTYYSDFPINMERNAVTGQLGQLINADAVKQALINLVLTDPKERPYQPWLGSRVKQSLFDNIDDALTIDAIQRSVTECIKNNDSRANVLKVNVFEDSDNNGYNVEIIFSILNITQPQTASFFLSRVR